MQIYDESNLLSCLLSIYEQQRMHCKNLLGVQINIHPSIQQGDYHQCFFF